MSRRRAGRVAACAVLVALATPVSAFAQDATVLFDRDLSPASGASLAGAVGRVVAAAEDAIVPSRVVPERGWIGRSANVGYRFARLQLFDQPQENWLRVANHEVFGHGGRLRELFDGASHYALPAPPPYGRGGGATYFTYSRQPTVEEALAVSVGGMEANRLVARALTTEALASGRWSYRDAVRYYYAERDTIRYILRTHDHESPGHDVGDFLRLYNEVAARHDNETLSARQLRRRVVGSFVNPMLAYAVYGTYGAFVARGRTESAVPMIPVGGGLRYLPITRFQLTPFGTEWVIDNAVARGGRLALVSVRVGQTLDARAWGLGVETPRVASIRGWTVGARANVWRQAHRGGEATATVSRRVGRVSAHPVSLVVQAGFKSDGYLAGEPLHRSGILRVGASLGRP